jgi:hypothetical protein
MPRGHHIPNVSGIAIELAATISRVAAVDRVVLPLCLNVETALGDDEKWSRLVGNELVIRALTLRPMCIRPRDSTA